MTEKQCASAHYVMHGKRKLYFKKYVDAGIIGCDKHDYGNNIAMHPIAS
jgi:hypothetical protein